MLLNHKGSMSTRIQLQDVRKGGTMQVGSLHVFPKANRRMTECNVCGAVIRPYAAFVHHYKVNINRSHLLGKPKRPLPGDMTYTRQLHFCSMECAAVKDIGGVYE